MDKVTRTVGLKGIRPIMFDRYAGDNKTTLDPLDKVYKDKDGNLTLPSVNVMSFLSAQNTESAPQRMIGRGWKAVAKAALSFVDVNPIDIPFLRDGKPIAATADNLEIRFDVARMKKGQLAIPNPKERPVLHVPWSLRFEITLFENGDLKDAMLRKLFENGGISIGFGTFRGVFGKFIVETWE